MNKAIAFLCGTPLLFGCTAHEKTLLVAADPHSLQVAQDQPPSPPPPSPPTPERWYGWQLIAAYAPIDFALLWGAYFAMNKELNTAIPFLALGYGGHFVAGGFIHKYHDGDQKKSQGAMLMQVGIMATGLTIGILATPKSEATQTKMPSTATMLAGSFGGAIVAGLIDVGLFSWEPVYGRAAQRNTQWMVLPTPIGEKGMGIRAGGSF